MLIKHNTTHSDDCTNDKHDKDNSDKERKRKSKKKSEKHKHKRKEKSKKKSRDKSKEKDKKKQHNNHELDSKDSLDLSQEMWPIAHYITDRREMLQQMFSAIGWKQVKAMLPKHLKNTAIEQISELCLGELLGMSKRRIVSIIAGQPLENSSESEVEDSNIAANSNVGKITNVEDNHELQKTCTQTEKDSTKTRSSNKSKEKQKKKSKHHEPETVDIKVNPIKKKQNSDPEMDGGKVPSHGKLSGEGESDIPSDLDTLEIGITHREMGELLEDSSTRKRSVLESALNVEEMIPIKKPKPTQSSNSAPSPSGVAASGDESEVDPAATPDDNNGRTLFDILELEMRARAIRMLLTQQSDDEDMPGSQSPKLSTEQLMDKISSEDEEDFTCNPIKVPNTEHGTGTENVTASSVCSTKRLSKNAGVKSSKHVQAELGASNSDDDLKIISSRLYDSPSRNAISSEGYVSKIVAASKKKNLRKVQYKDELSTSPSSLQITVSSKRHKTTLRSKRKDAKSSFSDGVQTNSATDFKSLKPLKNDVELVDLTTERVSEKHSFDTCDSTDLTYESPFLEDLSQDSVQEVSKESTSLSAENMPCVNVASREDCTNLSPTEIAVIESCDLIEPRDAVSEVRKISANRINSTEIDLKVVSDSVCRSDDTSTKENSKEPFSTAKHKDVIASSPGLNIPSDSELLLENKKQGDTSWASRWLKSKDVQKVVTTSKMCAKIRKRMKSQKWKMEPNKGICKTQITGSVEEYRTLDKSGPLVEDSTESKNEANG